MKKKPVIVVTNTFSIWMNPNDNVLRFKKITVNDLETILKNAEVKYWFSNQKSQERIKKLLKKDEIHTEENFPMNWSKIIVIGGRNKITLIEHVSMVIPT